MVFIKLSFCIICPNMPSLPFSIVNNKHIFSPTIANTSSLITFSFQLMEKPFFASTPLKRFLSDNYWDIYRVYPYRVHYNNSFLWIEFSNFSQLGRVVRLLNWALPRHDTVTRHRDASAWCMKRINSLHTNLVFGMNEIKLSRTKFLYILLTTFTLHQ